MKRSLRSAMGVASALTAALMLAAAPAPPAPAPFAPATELKLSNGVIIASQPASDMPLVGAQIFLPAGLAQQPADKAGIAALTASVVMQTPVDGSTTLAASVAATGGSISYTLDPTDTRFYLECRTSEYPRLLHELLGALAHPDLSRFATQRAKTLASANALTNNPLETAYAMVRQIRYRGTGFALPDQGSAISVAGLSASDITAFVDRYDRGAGTIVALEGAVAQPIVDATAHEFSALPATAAQPVPAASPVDRVHQVVAHRDVDARWVAVAYEAPNQYSADFATMLVIEALLGAGGDVHALSSASNEPAPDDFIGAYYQYEAKPGSMIVFLGGDSSSLEQSVRDLVTGVARLRGDNLSDQLVTDAKRLALSEYFLSVTDLDDLGWLLGRSAASTEGVAFENSVPQRINAVSAADIQRVARRYLTKETIAVVLPQAEGQ
jgi:zinc protease